MKTTEEFLEYYKTTIEPEFERAPKPKSKSIKTATAALIFLGFIVVEALFWFIFKVDSKPIMLFSTVVFVIWGIIRQANIEGDVADNGIRDSDIDAMIQFYAPDMKYTPGMGMLDKTVEISNLFTDISFTTNNSIEGQINNTYLQLASFYILTDKVTVFKGLYMMTTFNKKFSGQYVVFSGFHLPPYVDVPGHGSMKLKEIKLENPDFNKLFSAYGTGDEEETRYLFTPAMMERMVDAKKNWGGQIHFAFARNRMFFAPVILGNSLYSGTGSTNHAEVLECWSNIMHFTLSLPEQFHLDEHLWSKP